MPRSVGNYGAGRDVPGASVVPLDDRVVRVIESNDRDSPKEGHMSTLEDDLARYQARSNVSVMNQQIASSALD
jgi:hypothetical protein